MRCRPSARRSLRRVRRGGGRCVGVARRLPDRHVPLRRPRHAARVARRRRPPRSRERQPRRAQRGARARQEVGAARDRPRRGRRARSPGSSGSRSATPRRTPRAPPRSPGTAGRCGTGSGAARAWRPRAGRSSRCSRRWCRSTALATAAVAFLGQQLARWRSRSRWSSGWSSAVGVVGGRPARCGGAPEPAAGLLVYVAARARDDPGPLRGVGPGRRPVAVGSAATPVIRRERSVANGTPMGRTVTAVGRSAGPASAPSSPSGWEHDVRDRLVAGDDAALREVYDQYASFVYGLALARHRRRPRRRGREPGRVRRVLGTPGGVRPERGQPADLARARSPTAGGRLRAPRGGPPPSRRAGGEPGGRRARRRGDGDRAASPPSACAPRSTCCRASSAGPSSSRTSAGRPTVRSPRCSASPRAPPSRGCASALRRIADALEAEGDEW